MKNIRAILLRLSRTVFVVGILFLGLCILTPSEARAEFSQVGTTNHVLANGLTRDRNVVIFDKFIVEAHLESYSGTYNYQDYFDRYGSALDSHTHKGVLRIRKSGDGFTWTEALSNPADIISGAHFFLAKDMTGNPNCAVATDCNLYLIYFRNDAVSCDFGGDTGQVYFRELTFDQDTELWTLQAEMQITHQFDDTYWWDAYYSYNRYSSIYSCEPEPAMPMAEPKPQIWVEGNRAMILYDIQVRKGAIPSLDPEFEGIGYTYLRTKSMTRTGTGTWTIDAGSSKDIGAVKNCTAMHVNSYSPFDNIEPNAFVTVTLLKNPLTNKFGVVYDRTIPGWYGCGYDNAFESSYDVGPFLTGGGLYPPEWVVTAFDNPADLVPLTYIENSSDGFTWTCGRNAGDVGTLIAQCSNKTILNSRQYPGENISVVSNTGSRKAMRVAYPQYDTNGNQHIVMEEWRQTTAVGTHNWMAGEVDLSVVAEIGDKNKVLSVIAADGDYYWVAFGSRTLAAGEDYRVQYRKMRLDTTDANPLNWFHTPVYPHENPGEIEYAGTTEKDLMPSMPHLMLPNFLTTLGHPSLTWVHGSTPSTDVFFPENVAGVRIYGWAWSPIIGWISLDYLNTGTLASQRYGMYIDENTNVLKGEMWSPNFGWITSLRRVCSNNSHLACTVDADCPGGAGWTDTGTLTNMQEVRDLLVASNGDIFAAGFLPGPDGIVYKSSDGGASWVNTDGSGVLAANNNFVNSLLQLSNGTILAGVTPLGLTEQIYQYNEASNNWSAVIDLDAVDLGSPYFPGSVDTMIQARDGTIYVGTCCDGGIFMSSDQGATWQFSAYLTDDDGPELRSLVEDDSNNIYVGSAPEGNVYKLQQDGSWTNIGDMPGVDYIESLMVGEDRKVYAGAGSPVDGSAWRLELDGSTWTETGNIPGATDIFKLYQAPDRTLFAAGGAPSQVWRYDVLNDTWNDTAYPSVAGVWVISMVAGKDGYFYAGNDQPQSHVYKRSFCLDAAGSPPTDDVATPPYLARFNTDYNRIEGWARIMSMKDEGEGLDWRDGGQRWLPVENVSQTDFVRSGTWDHTTLSVDSEGNPHVAWSNKNKATGVYDIYYLKREGDVWVTATGDKYEPGAVNSGLNVSNSAGESSRPSLEVDSYGNAHIAWVENEGNPYSGGDVWYGYWNSALSVWQTEQVDSNCDTDLNDPNNTTICGTPSLKLDRNNQPHVAYRSGNDIEADIYYRKRTGGGWVSVTGDANNLNVSEIAADNQRSWLPSLELSSDASQYPHIVWSEITGAVHIYYRYWNGSNWVTASGDATQGSGAANISANDDIAPIIVVGAPDGNNADLDLYSDNRPGIVWRDPGHVVYRQWKNGDWVDANPDDGLHDDTEVNHEQAGETWRTVHPSESMAVHIDSSDRPHIVWSDDTETVPQIGDVQYRYWDKFVDGGNGDWVTVSGDYEDNGIPPLLNYDDANLNVSQTPGIYSRTVAFDLDQSGDLHIIWSDTEYTGNVCANDAACEGVPGYPNCVYLASLGGNNFCAVSDVFYRSWFPGRNWGWIRFNGMWDRTSISTTLRQQLSSGEMLARVLSTTGFPYDSVLRMSTGTGIEEDIPYGNIAEDTISLTSAASNTHPAGSSLRLAETTGTYEVGIQYLEDKAAFQLFDFAFSPQIGWIEFRPFRFIGFPYLTTEAGDIYSGENIEIPAPPAPTGEFTSTYLIQADGTISPYLSYGIRSVPGATSLGGYTCDASGVCTLATGSTSFLEEGVGDFGYPGISEGYENVLGKLDIDALTTVVSDCEQLVCNGGANDGILCFKDGDCDSTVCGTPRSDCTDLNDDLAVTTGDDINGATCFNLLGLSCENDGRGKNIFGGVVDIHHAPAGFGNAPPFDYSGSSIPVDLNGNGSTDSGELFKPVNLNGKIYYYPNGSVYIQSSFVFKNGSGTSGAGMVISRNARFQADVFGDYRLIYDIDPVSNIKELPSFLMVSTMDIQFYSGLKEIAGSYVALGNSPYGVIDTCNYGSTECTEAQLVVRGILMGRRIEFNRKYGIVNDVLVEPSEIIINDGRLLANPPLGLQDLSQSLPRFNQVKP